MPKQSNSSQTWECQGTSSEPHDPFLNFAPNCSVCGAEKPKTPLPPPPPVPKVAIALGAGAIALLGSGFLISPYIPGLCEVRGHCQEWSNQFAKAKQAAQIAREDIGKAKTLADLQDAHDRLSQAVSQLTPLMKSRRLRTDLQKVLPGYQETLTQAADRLTQEAKHKTAFDQAEATAKQAADLTEKAKKAAAITAFNTARSKWEAAIDQAKKVPEQSLLFQVAKTKIQEYTKQLQAVDSRIADIPPPVSPPPETNSESSPTVYEPVYEEPPISSDSWSGGSSSVGQAPARPAPAPVETSREPLF